MTIDQDLREVRCNDPRRVRAIAAGGGPRYEGDDWHLWCPRCRCNKSGDASEPNGVTEACEDPRCLCHDDDAVAVSSDEPRTVAVFEHDTYYPSGGANDLAAMFPSVAEAVAFLRRPGGGDQNRPAEHAHVVDLETGAVLAEWERYVRVDAVADPAAPGRLAFRDPDHRWLVGPWEDA